jgi:hypothetical protein
MRERLQARLEILKNENRMGQAKLHELEQQEISLRETLLRISGAIQVLEELLAGSAGAANSEVETSPLKRKEGNDVALGPDPADAVRDCRGAETHCKNRRKSHDG